MVEVGGAGTFQQSIQAIRTGGHIGVDRACWRGCAKDLNVAAIFGANAHINGVTVGSREHFEAMCRAISANEIHPVVDKRFRLDEAQAAFRSMKAGEHFGKLVIGF